MENKFEIGDEVQLLYVIVFRRFGEMARSLNATKWKLRQRRIQYRTQTKLRNNRGVIRNFADHLNKSKLSMYGIIYLVYFPFLDEEFLISEANLKACEDFASIVRKVQRKEGVLNDPNINR